MMKGEARPVTSSCPLSIVTGSPGAGKSSVAEALIARNPPFLVFDADWLLDDISLLTGQAVAETSHLWPQYRRLWIAIARMIGRNGRHTVLFIPVEPAEIVDLLPASWRGTVQWCLLDCDDQARRERLQARGWGEDAINDAIADGEALRRQIVSVVDTSRSDADEVAAELLTRLAVFGIG